MDRRRVGHQGAAQPERRAQRLPPDVGQGKMPWQGLTLPPLGPTIIPGPIFI